MSDRRPAGRVSVRVPNWLIGDGEFGPVAVGDVVHVGLAWLTVDAVESVTELGEEALVCTADGHARCVGRWEIPEVPGIGSTLAVVVSGPYVLPVLGEVAGTEGPVAISGLLGVELLTWDARGYLWPKYPYGVRAWRLLAARTLPDRASRPGLPGLETVGQDEFVVDLEAINAV